VYEVLTGKGRGLKPYLFIDVDGVLNPERNTRLFDRYEILGFIVFLRPAHGKHLLGLQEYYELVWATSWEHLANEHIGPKIGLPELPVVEFGNKYPTARMGKNPMIKTAKVMKYANGRPFAWIDDDIMSADRAFLIDNDCHCFPLEINPNTGLTAADIAMLKIWGKEQHDKAALQADAVES
jgi:hypothetical protein